MHGILCVYGPISSYWRGGGCCSILPNPSPYDCPYSAADIPVYASALHGGADDRKALV